MDREVKLITVLTYVQIPFYSFKYTPYSGKHHVKSSSYFFCCLLTIQAALCSGNAAKLKRLCSCLAVEVILQRAAMPLCSAVRQFAAILLRQSVGVK